MQAIVQEKYGSGDVLETRDLDKPQIGDGDVLVRVHAASVHVGDWILMTGSPFVMRFATGLRKPANPVPGTDLAGTVEAVGKDVTRHRPGDEVFGWCAGAFAEYASAPEDQLISKPANLTFEQAAAVGVSATTALQLLRDNGKVQPGQKVLINGASGGVGTFAVQIAKAFGAEVTGVCSTRNIELVRSLGADHVVDYKHEDFTTTGKRYDLIIDNVGNHSPLALRRALVPNGTVIIVGAPKDGPWIGTFWGIIRGTVLSWFVDEKFQFFIASLNRDNLSFLAGLAREGKMRSVIDRRYSLDEVPAAIDYLASWRARGKVVVNISSSEPQNLHSTL
jgi:NADPH:quinone reductase-like Zn-dependent oxidoreductase